MELAHALLALGMLITGSLNTIFTSWADKQMAVGTEEVATIWAKLKGEDGLNHKFDHPFFQALGMFVGEFLCMLVYLITRRKAAALAAQDPSIVVPGGRTKGALWFAFPAMLDILGTGTMYAGLCLTSASVFQMLRGASIVFTCILSVILLKRKIYGFQWVSVVMVIIGILIVGFVSITEEKPEPTKPGVTPPGSGSVIVGDILIITAQLATACQMCLEEKLMDKYPSPSLKVVGLEGFFGFWMLGLVLVAMYYIQPGGHPIENTPDAIHQLGNNIVLPIAMLGNAFSIAFFNFFGISVTQQLSASHRMVLDSVRTLVVWGVSLIIGWETFHPLQLLGFFFLTIGTCCYNKIFRIPGMFYPEETPAAVENPAGVSLPLAPDGGRERSGSELSTSIVCSLIKEESGTNQHSGSFHRT